MHQTLLPASTLSDEVLQDVGLAIISATAAEQDEEDNETLPVRILRANVADLILEEVRQAVASRMNKLVIKGYVIKHCSIDAGSLRYHGKLAITSPMVLDVINTIHTSKEVGHSGAAKTVEAIQRYYRIPNLLNIVRQYVRNYYLCRRAKLSTKLPARYL